MALERGPDGQLLQVIYDAAGREVSRQPVDVADARRAAAQRQADSHKAYFGNPKAFRSEEARRAAMERQLQAMAVDLATPPKTPEFRRISDDAFRDLMAHPEAWAEEGFTPLAHYRRKLTRPLWSGEVGLVEKADGTFFYYVLEEGYGRPTAVSNPDPPPDPEVRIDATPLAYGFLRADGTPSLVVAFDDDEALEASIDGGAAEVPVRLERFDACVAGASFHDLEADATAIRCRQCGVSWPDPPPAGGGAPGAT